MRSAELWRSANLFRFIGGKKCDLKSHPIQVCELSHRGSLSLAQLGAGARHLCRFNVAGKRVLKICNLSLFFTLKRRERRAPGRPRVCHAIEQASIAADPLWPQFRSLADDAIFKIHARRMITGIQS